MPRASYFLLYDRRLLKSSTQQKFIRSFPFSLGVDGGEEVKSLSDFSKILKKLLSSWKEPIHRQSTLIVFGGGSLGDLAGFLASTLKRGINLVQIPSTWLAAVDSSHGGKNGLNLEGIKNQLGTFYPAKEIWIVADVLQNQPGELGRQSLGEFLKMGLLSKDDLFLKMMKRPLSNDQWLWKFLKPCIQEKYKIVLEDPIENKNRRQLLNFGHTFGHVYESHYRAPHGDSVLQGIFFALSWSVHKKIMTVKEEERILSQIKKSFDVAPANLVNRYKPIPSKKAEHLLFGDKKLFGKNQLKFVFLKTAGKALIRTVDPKEILAFAQSKKWVR